MCRNHKIRDDLTSNCVIVENGAPVRSGIFDPSQPKRAVRGDTSHERCTRSDRPDVNPDRWICVKLSLIGKTRTRRRNPRRVACSCARCAASFAASWLLQKSSIYRKNLTTLAVEWSQRGERAVGRGDRQEAIEDFTTALHYRPATALFESGSLRYCWRSACMSPRGSSCVRCCGIVRRMIM